MTVIKLSKSNSTVMWVVLLLRTWEIPVSTLSQDASHPEATCGFLQSLQVNAPIPRIRPRSLAFTYFSVQYSIVILPFDVIQSELLTSLLYKP